MLVELDPGSERRSFTNRLIRCVCVSIISRKRSDAAASCRARSHATFRCILAAPRSAFLNSWLALATKSARVRPWLRISVTSVTAIRATVPSGAGSGSAAMRAASSRSEPAIWKSTSSGSLVAITRSAASRTPGSRSAVTRSDPTGSTPRIAVVPREARTIRRAPSIAITGSGRFVHDRGGGGAAGGELAQPLVQRRRGIRDRGCEPARNQRRFEMDPLRRARGASRRPSRSTRRTRPERCRLTGNRALPPRRRRQAPPRRARVLPETREPAAPRPTARQNRERPVKRAPGYLMAVHIVVRPARPSPRRWRDASLSDERLQVAYLAGVRRAVIGFPMPETDLAGEPEERSPRPAAGGAGRKAVRAPLPRPP